MPWLGSSFRRLSFAVAALSFPLQPAFAQGSGPPDASGTAVAVIQDASAKGPGGERVLGVQQPVYSGDTITTDALGEAQILFRDETRLVVAPNSQLLIDKFVYSGEASAKQVSVNMVKGALRFISGKSPSKVYSVRTPSATIGVRGTEFDVALGDRGETGLLLFAGAVNICNAAGGACVAIEQACEAALALPSGAVGRITSRQNRNARLRARFPLLVRQAQLRPDFRVSTGACAALDATPGGPGPIDSGDPAEASGNVDVNSGIDQSGGNQGDNEGNGD